MEPFPHINLHACFLSLVISSVADMDKKVYVAQLFNKKISHFLNVEFVQI